MLSVQLWIANQLQTNHCKGHLSGKQISIAIHIYSVVRSCTYISMGLLLKRHWLGVYVEVKLVILIPVTYSLSYKLNQQNRVTIDDRSFRQVSDIRSFRQHRHYVHLNSFIEYSYQ